MIILNEKEHAEKCLQEGNIGDNPFETISILARYYYTCLGYRKKKIYTLLIEFLSKYYSAYELNEFSWQTSVERVAANAGKYPLHQIDGVKITKSEMETIKSIHNANLERLMFTMLCLAKFWNLKNEKNNGWVNYTAKDIFTYARISSNSYERDIKIGKLWNMGLLEFSKRNDNLNCRVTFINDNDDEALFVSDFRELGYEYLYYCGERFIRCGECGILTKNNPNGTKKYCEDCSEYTPINKKKMVCDDCGIEFEVDARVSNKKRCNDCQNVVNREKKRMWKQKKHSKIIFSQL